jgi:hypothetical protein
MVELDGFLNGVSFNVFVDAYAALPVFDHAGVKRLFLEGNGDGFVGGLRFRVQVISPLISTRAWVSMVADVHRWDATTEFHSTTRHARSGQ